VMKEGPSEMGNYLINTGSKSWFVMIKVIAAITMLLATIIMLNIAQTCSP